MTIEHALRTQVSRAYGEISWKQNPLVAIGLSQAILSLRVTEEQLFKIVRGYVRQLAAAVHTDRSAGNAKIVETQEIADERARIMEAFELLDDEKTFQKALEEFKILSSAERSELAGMRAALDKTRSQLDIARSELGELTARRVAFDREKKLFELNKDFTTRTIVGLTEKYNNTDNERSHWHTLFEKKQALNRRYVAAIERYRLCTMLHAPNYFAIIGGGGSDDELPILAYEPQRVTVLRFFFIESVGKPQSLALDTLSERAQRRYHEAVEKLVKLGEKNIPDAKPSFFIQRLNTRIGIIGRGERMIGSIAFDEVMKTTYKHVEKMPLRFVAERLIPFLIPGQIIASAVAPRVRKNLSPGEDIYPILKSLKTSRPEYLGRTSTCRVLLEAE